MTEGVVYLCIKNKADIIKEYYTRCGLETIGPSNRIPVKDIITVTSFEELVDKMLTRSEWVHIIVCHGSPEQGILLPLARGGVHNATGQIIEDLAVLAETHKCLTSDSPTYGGRIKFIADGMGVKKEKVTLVAEKLGVLHSRKCIVEIRGCNIGADRDVLGRYRRAFGHMTSAPTCRMLYLRMLAGRPPWGKTINDLKTGSPTRPKTRRRAFEPTGPGVTEPLVIDITDIDGHTNVSPAAFMTNPKKASEWANNLLTVWRQAPGAAGSSQFVLPVMYDDLEPSWHTPADASFTTKLRTIP